MTAIEIVKEYLESHGYDGLYSPIECGCEVSDLAPCGQMAEDCTAGYKIPCQCGEGCPWDIGSKAVRDSLPPWGRGAEGR